MHFSLTKEAKEWVAVTTVTLTAKADAAKAAVAAAAAAAAAVTAAAQAKKVEVVEEKRGGVLSWTCSCEVAGGTAADVCRLTCRES